MNDVFRVGLDPDHRPGAAASTALQPRTGSPPWPDPVDAASARTVSTSSPSRLPRRNTLPLSEHPKVGGAAIRHGAAPDP
jgi:hypothetical protein